MRSLIVLHTLMTSSNEKEAFFSLSSKEKSRQEVLNIWKFHSLPRDDVLSECEKLANLRSPWNLKAKKQHKFNKCRPNQRRVNTFESV